MKSSSVIKDFITSIFREILHLGQFKLNISPSVILVDKYNPRHELQKKWPQDKEVLTGFVMQISQRTLKLDICFLSAFN